MTTCPHCQHPHSTSAGQTSAGSPRRRCKGCGRKYTIAPQQPGPAPTYASAAEKQAAYRLRNGLSGNEARDGKKADPRGTLPP